MGKHTQAVRGDGFDHDAGGFSHIWIGSKKYPAHIIAAAPDMLEALKDAAYGIRYCYEHGIEEGMDWRKYVAAMDAAIAKAEGK